MNPSEQERKEMSTKEVLLYSLGGLLLLGTTFFVGRKLIRDAVSKNEERGSAEDGSIASYAKAIKMAFDNDGWWGTDEEALRTVLITIPTKSDFDKVAKSYQKLYHKTLMADMQSELQTSEYNEMKAIINSKPESKNTKSIDYNKLYETWARRLKAAFDITYGFFPGTDEDAIKAVFDEMPTQTAFKNTAITYQNLFHRNLLSDLKSELEFWEYDPMMKIIYSKPN